MLNIVHDKSIAPWVLSKIDDVEMSDLGPYESIGVVINGAPAAGVIYSNYKLMRYGNDIQVWIRGEKNMPWARRPVLRRLFEYPFIEANCERISCIIKEGNLVSEKFCKKLGFRKEGTLWRGYNGKSNALIYGMIKKNCSWL